MTRWEYVYFNYIFLPNKNVKYVVVDKVAFFPEEILMVNLVFVAAAASFIALVSHCWSNTQKMQILIFEGKKKKERNKERMKVKKKERKVRKKISDS